MVMVKAFSYGLGTYEVAQVLEQEGVDYLGVANILEGVEIRKSGVKSPIMVMNPETESFDLMIKYQLSPVIFSLKNLSAFVAQIKKIDTKLPYPIQIKIDTGMHRLGFNPKEIEELILLLKQNEEYVKIESIFSHLAASDEPYHDSFTDQQANLFESTTSRLNAKFNYQIDRHLLNTNGIIRFTKYQYEMVRLGIGLYGICADEDTQKKLKTVSTLKSKISHIIKVQKNDTVGYNRKGAVDKDKTIATIPLGYADGFNRLLSNGNWEVLVKNQKAPVIGNISMDMSMIDVSNIDCQPGDEVVIFGKQNTISDMATRIKTIPYELFTIISPRVKRVFYKK